jgi:hypothetical protein
MKVRMIVLLVAAIGVVVVTEYRVAQPDAPQSRIATDEYSMSMAPSFAGYDARTENLHLFRLKSYIGRHAMIIAFCGKNADVATDANVKELIAQQETILSKGFKVVVVSANLPQEIRKNELPDGFDLVSDVEQSKRGELFGAHKAFRSFDSKTNQPNSRLFFIDRAGNVPVDEKGPVALLDPVTDLKKLLGIE